MKPALRLACALFLPVFFVVFIVVRAVWRAYVTSLSESQLHERVFEHRVGLTLALWSGCIVVTVGLSVALGHLYAWLRGNRSSRTGWPT